MSVKNVEKVVIDDNLNMGERMQGEQVADESGLVNYNISAPFEAING